MHHRPHEKKNCHSREGGNPKPIGEERKVQLIMFTYLYVKIYLVKLQINYGIGKKIGTP